MPVSDFQAFIRPVLEVLADGRNRVMRSLTEDLGIRFGLTPEELREMLPSAQKAIFRNREAWAKARLPKAPLRVDPAIKRAAEDVFRASVFGEADPTQ